MMTGKMDHKSKAIEELMAYLDKKDGDELGSAMKPKEVEIEIGAEGAAPGMGEAGEESPGMPAEAGDSGMSEEEMAELIEAIQSKLGSEV